MRLRTELRNSCSMGLQTLLNANGRTLRLLHWMKCAAGRSNQISLGGQDNRQQVLLCVPRRGRLRCLSSAPYCSYKLVLTCLQSELESYEMHVTVDRRGVGILFASRLRTPLVLR
jgi:hypothetical protein